MLKHKAEVISYSIELPDGGLATIYDIERPYEDIGEYDFNLSSLLDKHTAAIDTDYNGHFGNSVFLKLEADDDTPEEWEKINKIIENYLVGILKVSE